MTDAFEFFMLPVSVILMCYGNTLVVTQTSEFECSLHNNSSVDQPMNVHMNLSEEEYDLLQIEGRCFLLCVTDIYKISIRNYSLSGHWPFVPIDQIDCNTVFEVHECTRGCLRRHRRTYLEECNMYCQQTCRSVVESEECNQPFLCHPWIPVTRCQNLECEINYDYLYHPCRLGCLSNSVDLREEVSPADRPRDPIGPPLLIQDPSTGTVAGQFKFVVDLFSAAPQICGPAGAFTESDTVAFLFKFVDKNSGNVSYKWTASPSMPLDLTGYACQELLVSFAVSNKRYGLSRFSPEVPLIVNGDEQLIPVPPNDLTVSSEKIDERVEFFGHVILNISWNVPQNTSLLDYYMITVTTAAGFDTTMCGCTPWIRKAQLNESFISIEAESLESLPFISCSYDIQIYSVGPFGASYPVKKTYTVNATLGNIDFKCQRLWQSNGISFNLTWIISPDLLKYNVISGFVVDLNLKDIVNNVTDLIDTTEIPFPQLQDGPMTFTHVFNADHDLNTTFLKTLLVEKSWAYHLESHVIWNISGTYEPPEHIYTCVESTFYSVPGLVEDVSISSCSNNGTDVILYLEWSPPSVITGELEFYDVCIGNVSLMPDQEMPSTDDRSQKCLNLIKETNQSLMKYNIEGTNYSLYVQIRAGTVHGIGNWSEPLDVFSLCNRDQEVHNSYVAPRLNIIIGAVLGSIAIIILLSLLGLVMWIKTLRQRKKSQTVQGSDDQILFNDRRRNFYLQSILASLAAHKKGDRWEIPLKEVIVKDRLGEGAFGDVYKGIIRCPIVNPNVRTRSTVKKSIYTPVAIKQLKPSAPGNERQDFLSEIEMMKKVAEGQNPHVVGFLGCVTIQEPLCLITEFVKFGDLLSYLRINRRMYTGCETEDDSNDDAYVHLGDVSPLELVSFAYQISSGMEYLSSLGIVHRDLACRNILVDEGKVLKITDFGLSRETDEIYVQKRIGRVPLKWMAIESIIAREFTSASDVWSFGVVLWEIGTLGGIPYPSIQNEDLISMLNRGYRMEKPDNCSPEVYDIMSICWNEQPKERPTFKELRAKFDAMLLTEKKDNVTYITLCIDKRKPYYQSLTLAVKNQPVSKKLASSKASTASLDETRRTDERTESNQTRRPERLSLQFMRHGQQEQSQDRYVPSPSMSPAVQEKETGLKVVQESVKQKYPKITISICKDQN